MLDFLFVRQNPNSVQGGARNCQDGTYHAGTLTVDDDELVFDGMDARVSLPLEGLHIRRNRWFGGAIRFAHPQIPDWILLTKDVRIFKAPEAEEDFLFVNSAEKCRVHFQNLRRTFKLTLLALLLLMIFVPTARVFVVDRAVQYVPLKTEADFGESLFHGIPQSKLIHDPVVLSELKIVTDRILSGLPPEDRAFDLKFHIICDPSVNAFAIPGGHIVIHSGLISDAEDADEIAGVLGHEIGHVTRRHALSKFVESIGAWGILTFLIGNSDDATNIAMVLTSSKFSRDHETAADEMGWHYACAAELDARGLRRFFERIERKERKTGGSPSDLDNLLRSHPLTHERVAALDHLARIAAPKTPRPMAIDFADFKSRVERWQQASLARQ